MVEEATKLIHKYLRDDKEQQLVDQEAIIDFLQKNN